MRYVGWPDSNSWRDVRLDAGKRTHAPQGDATGLSASFNGNGDRLFYGVFAVGVMRERSVSFQDHAQRFSKIPFGFSERSPLRIHARNLFDVGNIPLTLFCIDRRELTNHRGPSISEPPQPVKHARRLLGFVSSITHEGNP